MMVDGEKGANSCLGIEIVLQELDVVLAHFSDWLQSVTAKGVESTTNAEEKKKRKKSAKGSSMAGMEIRLEILLQLAPHIEQAHWAEECLLQLLQLLPTLKQQQRPDTLAKILMIAQSLVGKLGDETGSTSDAEKMLDLAEMILPLFARLSARRERAELVRLVDRLAETQSGQSLTAVSHICASLNAMDRKRIEEPDFELRMRTYLSLRERVTAASSMTESSSSSASCPFTYLELAAVVFNCCYALRHEQDASLKTNALDTLLVACQAIGRLATADPEAGRRLVNKICLEQIRSGLKKAAKDDMLFCDHLAFLQGLVAHCGAAHARLKDLAKLLCPGDVDADFFENIRHVQLHRRGRAMSRLAKQLIEAEEGNFLLVKNLTQLVMPVCTGFLLNEAYVKHSQLVEQAIELLGAVCHALPWPQYETYVR
jgi:U3 small nucleolar RNA-associated protein 20